MEARLELRNFLKIICTRSTNSEMKTFYVIQVTDSLVIPKFEVLDIIFHLFRKPNTHSFSVYYQACDTMKDLERLESLARIVSTKCFES